jgi:WD40 repeat protein
MFVFTDVSDDGKFTKGILIDLRSGVVTQVIDKIDTLLARTSEIKSIAVERSPDGSMFAYWNTNAQKTDYFVSVVRVLDGESRSQSMPLETSITPVGWLSWSPDSRYVAYNSTINNGMLVLIDLQEQTWHSYPASSSFIDNFPVWTVCRVRHLHTVISSCSLPMPRLLYLFVVFCSLPPLHTGLHIVWDAILNAFFASKIAVNAGTGKFYESAVVEITIARIEARAIRRK